VGFLYMKKEKSKSGDSNFNCKIEKKALNWYAKEHDLVFDDNSPVLDGCSVQIDGYSKSELTAVEVYAHVGNLNAGNVNKVTKDTLKLILLDESLQVKHKVLLFVDEDVRKAFGDKSKRWIAICIQKFGIETCVYPLTLKDRKKLLEFQKKQGANFKK